MNSYDNKLICWLIPYADILNAHNTSDTLRGESFDFDGDHWFLSFNPYSANDDTYSAIYLGLTDPGNCSLGWHKTLSFTFMCVRKHVRSSLIRKCKSHKFIPDNPDWGFVKFLCRENFSDYVIGGHITVICVIKKLSGSSTTEKTSPKFKKIKTSGQQTNNNMDEFLDEQFQLIKTEVQKALEKERLGKQSEIEELQFESQYWKVMVESLKEQQQTTHNSAKNTPSVQLDMTPEKLETLSVEELQTVINLTNTLHESAVRMIITKMKPPPSSKKKKNEKCNVCWDKEKDTIFLPCGHVCCCSGCATQVKLCPLCREKIKTKNKAFL